MAEKGMRSNVDERIFDERYKAFIENINDGVYEADVHGNFTYFNNSFCKVLGYSGDEIEGANFSKFMDRKNSRRAYNAFSRVWITHKGFSDIIWEVLDQNGKTRIIELSANLIRDKKGKKQGFRGIARDVTERFKAQDALKKSELRYQRAYEASRRAEKQARALLNFVPYPMVVFSLDGKVVYLNPAFTEIFGWTLSELRGKGIPYVPQDLQKATEKGIKRLFKERMIKRLESRRLTKDGRILDVILRAAVFSVDGDASGGELVILRDITREKMMARNNEALLRISTALPIHPDLEELLDYVSDEVKRLLNVEAVHMILLDEEMKEFYFKSAAHDDVTAKKKVKEIRFPADEGIAGRVIKTGEPIIVHDTSRDPDFNQSRDREVGYHTRNIMEVPLRTSDRIIGVVCALNKKEGIFEQSDIELLNLISGTVALSIENAKFSDQLKDAYNEVSSLNRAKDKVITHLSHELKTPLAILISTLKLLEKRMDDQPEETWKPSIERAQRNLDRLLEIQYQVEDIMQGRQYRSYGLLSLILGECLDELEALFAEEVGEGAAVQRVRQHVEEIFGPKESEESRIQLDVYVQERLKRLQPQFAHREIEIVSKMSETPGIWMPPDVLKKIVDGLIKNAIENTPDDGKIEIFVSKKGQSSALVVRDYGVGITIENQSRIFEGFFATQETMAYSSKRPFDFDAGGKGSDLLRMKIFAERYSFKISMNSERCGFIPKESDVCPGKITQCVYCNKASDCHVSGGTIFSLAFQSGT